ncbi:META domain-containing protein [Sphingomonas sp. MG17]|uniref:META domain-containing protein n=1 Tax=Sphingomonas tagetis TaxID=2949092 RepID=A0A9X2HMP1_9SPHN|nr:META domain-containing protein [Sphingomonas tagetis]MCP3732487.1 META domain-containing protein [Sphingomonas tagetis]
MSVMLRPFPLLLAVAACSSAPSAAPSREAAQPGLPGKWRVIMLDGRALVVGGDGRQPVLTFDEHGYGAYVGCNAFGGQGLAHEGRLYGGFALSTAMACGPPFDTQEKSVQRLLASAPQIEWRGPDRVALISPAHRIELVRAEPLPPDRFVTRAMPLIGTAWSFGALDGQAIDMPGARSGPVLTVEGDRFTIETPCVVAEGSWAQTGPGAATLKPERRTARSCNAASRVQSDAWVTALRGALRYGNGPNGEILLAGGGHWMSGDLVRRGSSEARSLAGRYEVERSSGAAQRDGARRPELILASDAYSLWDGCNRAEGLAIAFERQLFLHPNGLATLANCPSAHTDDHLKRVVLSEPRIGQIPGGLLLSSPAGTVRLRRTGDIPPGAGTSSTRLVHGMRFLVLGKPGGSLDILPQNRFRLTQQCGVTEGRWRAAPRELDGAIRFAPERPAEACERDPAARPLQRAFLGNMDVVIGPNRDIALFAGRSGAVRARLQR